MKYSDFREKLRAKAEEREQKRYNSALVTIKLDKKDKERKKTFDKADKIRKSKFSASPLGKLKKNINIGGALGEKKKDVKDEFRYVPDVWKFNK